MIKRVIPKSLTKFEKFKFNKIKLLIPGNSLFLIDRHIGDYSLEVFRAPIEFNYVGKDLCGTFLGDRMKNLGWYVREYYERGNDLWNSFSEELIRDKIKDKKGKIYEVHCDQTFSYCGVNINPGESYVFNTKKGKDLKEIFYFGASELLKKLDSADFEDKQIKRLANFFYEDFTTMKHSEESRRIGQEADSIFF